NSSARQWLSALKSDLRFCSDDLAFQIDSAMENNSPRQSLTTMFQLCILDPVHKSTIAKPWAIILDGLDEGIDGSHELLTILRDGIPKLPPFFRIFITCRPDTTVAELNLTHIHQCSLDIHGEANRADMSTYIHEQFRQIAETEQLGDWPDASQMELFKA